LDTLDQLRARFRVQVDVLHARQQGLYGQPDIELDAARVGRAVVDGHRDPGPATKRVSSWMTSPIRRT